MDNVKKWGKKATDFLGYFIPNVTFTIIFLTFMLTIISRYVLKKPVAWSYEISVLAYMWTMFFGVGKALEADEHVVFGLVYDTLGDKGKTICKIVYNLLLIVLIGLAFVPCVHSMLSKKMVTGVLKLPYTVVFAPFIYMFAEVFIRCVIDMVHNCRALINSKKGAVK